MKVKKIPQRTCIGCKAVRPKKELIRIVRTPENQVLIDPTGKKSGRGAYSCPSLACLELAFKGSLLDKALETTLDETLKNQLRADVVKLIS